MKHQCVLTAVLVILGNCGAVFLAGCGGGTSQSFNHPPSGSNPTPTITSISPSSSTVGGPAFTLTINGTNFVAASMVNFNGTAPPTTFVSATQLTAAIPASAVASAGSAAVTVANPAPGGGTSNAVNFSIASGTNPVATITSLITSCAPLGAQSFTLGIIGSNFVGGSVARWNGSDRPTTVLDAINITAQIAANDLAASGTASVTVFNPTPGGGTSNSVTFIVAAGGVGPASIAVDPTGKFAYVANGGCPDTFAGNVSMFGIDGTTGALTSIGSPVAADFGPHSVTVDASGKFVYVANDGAFEVTGGSVSMYTINAATGALTSTGTIDSPCAPPPSPGSCSPFSVAVDPSGKFVYATNEGGFAPTSISMYSVNGTTGALTFRGVVSAAGRAVSVTVDPSDKFAYVATWNDPPGSAGNVSMYSIDGGTGALTSIGTISAGTNPVAVAVDSKGKFAYVANSGSNDLSMYTINTTTGALTSTGTIAAGAQPVSVAVDPTGKFAYVVNSTSNDVSMYTIDATTGALTSVGTIAVELSPTSVAIDPSGKFAYVTNSGSNSVSMYSIDGATGALTLIGTIGT